MSETDQAIGYVALPVEPDQQRWLRMLLEPRYPEFKGSHITLKFGLTQASEETAQWIEQFKDAAIRVVGTADDNIGVQCFMVEVNGATKNAAGRYYHLTWSIDPSKPAPAKYGGTHIESRHSGFVASQPKSVRLWNASDVRRFYSSARFYRLNVDALTK